MKGQLPFSNLHYFWTTAKKNSERCGLLYAGRTYRLRQQIEDRMILEGNEIAEIKHFIQQFHLVQDCGKWYSLPSIQLSTAFLL